MAIVHTTDNDSVTTLEDVRSFLFGKVNYRQFIGTETAIYRQYKRNLQNYIQSHDVLEYAIFTPELA